MNCSTQNFNQADIVIEAVFEDLSIKHRVIEEVEQVSYTRSSNTT